MSQKEVPDRNRNERRGHLSYNFKLEQIVAAIASSQWEGFLLEAFPLAQILNYLKETPASAAYFDFYQLTPWDTLGHPGESESERSER